MYSGIQPFEHRGESARLDVVHVAGDYIEDDQSVFKLEAESRVSAFAVNYVGHVFLGRHLIGDGGVAGDASAGEQALEAALTDQVLARLVEERTDALLTSLRGNAHVGAVEGLAQRVVGVE